MGEVGISTGENPTDSFAMNGDMNGSYEDDNDEKMEVDPLETLQEKPNTKNDTNFDSSKKDSQFTDEDEKSNITENSNSMKILDEKSQSCSSIPEDFDDRNNDDTNLTANGGDSTNIEKPNNDEIHDIDDSDDEDDDENTNEEKVVDDTRLHNKNESMDIDRASNGHMSMDDDKPVSIHSDSESENENTVKNQNTTILDKKGPSAEKESPKSDKTNTNGGEVHEILSDKEDCIVVEDEKKEDISPRRSQRQRKSVVKVRNFADFDDDIEEIKDDPLQNSSVKNLTKSLNNIRNSINIQSNISPFGQGVNQISIKDARSLAVSQGTTITKSSGNNIFAQTNLQQQLNSNKKEPSLVIIDTNQILSQRAAAQQSLNRNSFSVLPVGLPAQGLYPTNMRTSITSISKNLQLNQTNITPSLIQPHLNQASTTTQLLPALTDDMFVLEAPSFIVPYIYEKPPSENLREIVTKIGVELEESKKIDESDKKITNDDEKSKTTEDETLAVKEEVAGESKKEDVKIDESENSKKRKRKTKNGDDSWDESDTSTDEEASDTEHRTKILIKEIKEDIDDIKKHIITPESAKEAVLGVPATTNPDATKKDNYFESPLGKFFMTIGINLVQEHVQTDLLRQQKKKINREGGTAPPNIQVAINSLMKNLEVSRERNEPFKFDMKRCEYCNFKSESSLAMAHHYETPHMKNYIYKCNFCTFETRPPQDILFHMEAVHNIKGRLDKAVSYHQCSNCPFEDNGKSKLIRHSVVCAKKFRPEANLAPPADWEPPAKIPRIKPKHGLVGTATAYQAMAAQQQRATTHILPRSNQAQANALLQRGRIIANRPGQQMAKGGIINVNSQGGRNIQRNPGVGVLPTNFTTNQYLQQIAGAGNVGILPNFHSSLTVQSTSGPKSSKSVQQPSISITPLPRQSSSQSSSINHLGGTITKPPGMANLKPGQSPNGVGKNAFVICEICDGYIKDLDQLRNHMQWIHKIKIHPKMIYNRPPLNCQKCQYRFFTDQGLERHLLGSHGLVTSSMQEAANKGKDAGRCPVCGRIYQWKLLNHVCRDHSMTLKPAHLSYKCTVCTATFGMYKQFENHVYSAHSTVAKKSMDSRKNPSSSNSSTSNQSKMAGDSILKPLKINDEITIIPQPATKTLRTTEIESHVID